MERTAQLLSYKDFSARFPMLNHSDDMWNAFLARLRKKGQLKQDKHYKQMYYGHMRFMYSLRAVVQVLVMESRKVPPLPMAVYLTDTYYDDLLEILTGEKPKTSETDDTEDADSQQVETA